ncbi:hypothetical protein BSL78_23724 [Apostichopus japonicus]|uniref:Uncharacterized protein n=1 Tax=Stichopus japonicus TaxID=307972 RepID=A0A2G8JUM4_STIJA|nr:hypothetical protein BSL78_23724 [Apostichopus japonicus]
MHAYLSEVGMSGQRIVCSLHSELIASRLTHKICDVADHFTSVLQLVIESRGKANNSNMVQDVLRQAQTMAVLLSSLMRSIRMMQNYKQDGDRIIL